MTASQRPISGKIALVTGANSGLGLATVKRFVAEGATVFISGRRRDQLDAAVAELGSDVTGVGGHHPLGGASTTLQEHINEHSKPAHDQASGRGCPRRRRYVRPRARHGTALGSRGREGHRYTGRRQVGLDAAVEQIGHNATAIRGDISNAGDLDRRYGAIKEQFGRLDILFANAGVGELRPLGEITEEHFDKTFAINVKGTVFTVQKALPLTRAVSAIVINGSMVSVKGLPAFGVYAATKAALRSFARTWSTDLKGRGIRVNVVAPGTIIAPAYKAGGLSDEQIEGFKNQAAALAPLGRTGTADEIAKAVSFLASDDASYITGIQLFVDGGTAQI